MISELQYKMSSVCVFQITPFLSIPFMIDNLTNLSSFYGQGFILLCVTLYEYSFFEKISTGSNTDSDLRVVRFDGVN